MTKAEQDHITNVAQAHCAQEEHGSHQDYYRHKCREKMTATLARHAHLDNHIEETHQANLASLESEYKRNVRQSLSHMNHSRNSLHDHSLEELCGHHDDHSEKKLCEDNQMKHLVETGNKAYAPDSTKARENGVLDDVKSHVDKSQSGSAIPFFHENKKDSDTGGKGPGIGSILKGVLSGGLF